jgi:hypothetical protein
MQKQPLRSSFSTPAGGVIPNIRKEVMNYILNNFTGKNRLWEVFWLHNILLGGLITSATDSLLDSDSLVLLITVAWGVWVFAGLWQCAFNTKWKVFGYLARGIVVLGVVAIPLIFFVE